MDKLFNYSNDIPEDEYEIVCKLLNEYKNQTTIISDAFLHTYSVLPFEKEGFYLKTSDDVNKVYFQRKIYCHKKPYIVSFSFDLNILQSKKREGFVFDYNIVDSQKVKKFRYGFDIDKKKEIAIFHKIIETFTNKKIVSPEEAYCKCMHINKSFQNYISKHYWELIKEGIQKNPSLANELFLINEKYDSQNRLFSADFGTILYQLVSFKMNYLKSLDSKDLKQLDQLILKLSKTRLLKVQFSERKEQFAIPTDSMLLYSDTGHNETIDKPMFPFDCYKDLDLVSCQIFHSSQQYNTINSKLEMEQKTLKKCIKQVIK